MTDSGFIELGIGASVHGKSGDEQTMTKFDDADHCIQSKNGHDEGIEMKEQRIDLTKYQDRTTDTLSWRQITLTSNKRTFAIKDGKPTFPLQKKVILNGISGSVACGELFAILGSSGSGKTSLLNLLAGRTGSFSSMSGQVYFNGVKRNKQWRHIHGYIEQDQATSEHLTVYETLMYAARLRLPREMSAQGRQQRVQHIIDSLWLQPCKDTFVKHISGGERKRTIIGVELLKSVRVLFLDELTSGLDARMAFEVVESMHRLAVVEKKAIVMTIHQPRSSIARMFSKIYLLSRGELVFSGSINDAMTAFAQHGLNCEPDITPTDFLLDNIIVDTRSPEAERVSQDRLDKLIASWKLAHIDELIPFEDVSVAQINLINRLKLMFQDAVDQEHEHWRGRPSLWAQICVTFSRYMKEMWRNRSSLSATFIQVSTLAVIVSGLFWQMPLEQQSIQNRMGLLFFVAVHIMFGYAMQMALDMPEERKIIKRERRSVCYKTSAVYVAKVLSIIPQALIGAMVFSIVIYWTTGLQAGLNHFGIFIAMVASLLLCSQALGMIIGNLAPSSEVSIVLAPLVLLGLVVFTGSLVNLEKLPLPFRMVSYLSPSAYAYKTFMRNEFVGLNFECPLRKGIIPAPCFRNGLQVVKFFGVNDLTIWQGFSYMWSLTGVFHIISYVCLRFTTSPTMNAL